MDGRLENISILRISKSLAGVLLLIIGGMIYIIFRPDNLVMFSWFDGIGLTPYIEYLRTEYGDISIYSWIKYNMPAALWLFSYIFIIDSIWGKEKSIIFSYFIYVLPILALLSELMQAINLLPGTFDYMDLASYLIAIIVFLILKKF